MNKNHNNNDHITPATHDITLHDAPVKANILNINLKAPNKNQNQYANIDK